MFDGYLHTYGTNIFKIDLTTFEIATIYCQNVLLLI